MHRIAGTRGTHQNLEMLCEFLPFAESIKGEIAERLEKKQVTQNDFLQMIEQIKQEQRICQTASSTLQTIFLHSERPVDTKPIPLIQDYMHEMLFSPGHLKRPCVSEDKTPTTSQEAGIIIKSTFPGGT